MTEQIEKSTLLVVDDTPDNLDILTSVLQDTYKIKVALNGEKALDIASRKPHPDMILLDVMMPGMDGYEVCRHLKSDPRTAKIPVIFITALISEQDEEKGLKLGAVDYIFKPIRPIVTKSRVATHLALANQKHELEKEVALRTLELNQTRQEIIQRLGRAGEFKDNETGLHVLRMAHYSRLIAESYLDGSDDGWVERLFQVAPMHDIGKIGIPDKILLKKGKLDDEEWALMKQHPQFGAEIIGANQTGLLKMAYDVALFHHERWDGQGYPNGLKGEEIPLSARIAAIADVFDALTSERPYKKAWSIQEAAAYIQESAGSHFDPELVPHFVQSLDKIEEIQQKFAETVHFD